MAKSLQPSASELISQQRLISINIKRLKNLVDVEITFDQNKPLTAIMGPNGFGKSTILHILAASFRPTQVRNGNIQVEQGEAWQYINFFPKTPHASWSSVSATITHSFRQGSNPLPSTLSFEISKRTRQWLPIAESKSQREIYFLGVREAVPAIEQELIVKNVNYTTQFQTDTESAEVLDKVGYILKRQYSKFHFNTNKKLSLLGVEFQAINYSSLAMGAGEQRLFHLIRKVRRAGKYALILIDEIDLLLHTDALNRLLEVLKGYAESKKLQILFTTHRESVADKVFGEYVAVRHLYHSLTPPYKTLCFYDTKVEAISRLNGAIEKQLEIYCEDQEAKAIIEKLGFELNMNRFIKILVFGPAKNSFTLAAAIVLRKEVDSDAVAQTILVIDGDEYSTIDEQKHQLDKILTGTEGGDGGLGEQRRSQALALIRTFNSSTRSCPEAELYKMILSMNLPQSHETSQVVEAAKQAQGEADPKARVRKMKDYIGGDESRALGHIIDVAALSDSWQQYTAPVREWLEAQRSLITEQH